MKTSHTRMAGSTGIVPPAWRQALLIAMATALAVLGACGGGVGTGGTGSFASGPITGFGSVIVNDVRFDDQSAQVEDGDGNRRSRDDLRLGMTVDIDSDAIVGGAAGATGTATATRIRVDSELLGPVGTVDVAAGSFTVFGQRVAVDVTTVFDERLSTGLGGLAPGAIVQVFALFDPATARYRATRVEPAAATLDWRLRGPVADVSPVAQTVRIGGVNYSYAGASGLPAGLAAGQYVRIRLSAAGQPAGRFAILSFGVALQTLFDADGVKFKGLVTAFSSLSSFSVYGRAVSAAGAQFPAGTALAVGVAVEVEGLVRDGALQASKVTLLNEQQERERGFELTGAITAVDSAARTIVLRGQTVGTARPGLRYQNGSAADLAVGRRVQVKGLLSGDGRRVDATEIKFE